MNKLEFKNVLIDQDQKICYIDNKDIDLSRVEYELLVFFIENKNKIFSRRELLNEVWKSKVTLRTVDTTISRLRKKLGEFNRYIKTRQGFGYGIIE